MDNSQLVAIISRLDAMMKAGGNDPQSRRFEKNGDERGVVTYNPANGTFMLEEVATKQRFEFDNIDLAALEIFDLLDD
ncbi:YkuJ family protein [Ligilactobacillus sp. LYQ135]